VEERGRRRKRWRRGVGGGRRRRRRWRRGVGGGRRRKGRE